MRWRRNRGRVTPETKSLVKRLKALEPRDSPGLFGATAGRVVPSTVSAGRSRGLIRWFSLGFACACIGGGVAFLALLLVYPADAKPNLGACGSVDPVIRSDIMLETRELWSMVRSGPRMARSTFP